MHLWVNEGAILMAKICFQAAQNTITLKCNFHEPQMMSPTNENRAASLPYPPLHKAARLCCVKAMPLNRISCCLLTHVKVFSFFIQFAEEPWFSYQATYLLTNIPTYLKSTYLLLTYALFLPNNTFRPPLQCVLVHWPILHSIFLLFNFLVSESGNTQSD